jgi:hypothetical protein
MSALVPCPKCGQQFDPRVQSSFCGKTIRHYPVTGISEWQPPMVALPDKPKQRAPFQSDFMMLWDERQGGA